MGLLVFVQIAGINVTFHFPSCWLIDAQVLRLFILTSFIGLPSPQGFRIVKCVM